MTPECNTRNSKKPAKRTVVKRSGVEKSDQRCKVDLHRTRRTPALALQQSLLDVFRDSFSECFDDTLLELIQQVKGHLFARDFDRAFGSKPLLEAYSLRWSPGRALAYLDLVCGLTQISTLLRSVRCGTVVPLQPGQAPLPLDSANQADRTHEIMTSATIQTPRSCLPSRTTITCFGGGSGAEIMAFAGYMHHVLGSETSGEPEDPSRKARPPSEATQAAGFILKIVDMADWSSVIVSLHAGATTDPPLFQYAASNPRDQHGPLVDPKRFFVEFEQQDILCMEAEILSKAIEGSSLITLLFTLNELYSVSVSKATNFLLNLTFFTQQGTLLLVADSPGSYSTVRVGSSRDSKLNEAEKGYPMKWLLDHTLLEASSLDSSDNGTQKRQWEKITSNDSKWFRLSGDLKYPLDLEDMRYQYHLYKRL